MQETRSRHRSSTLGFRQHQPINIPSLFCSWVSDLRWDLQLIQTFKNWVKYSDGQGIFEFGNLHILTDVECVRHNFLNFFLWNSLPLSPLVQHSMEHWSFWPWREHYEKEGEVNILIIWHKWLGALELYPLSRQCLRVIRILGKRAPVCHKSGYPKGYESFMLFISCMVRRKCSHPTWDPQVPLLSIYFCLIPFKLCTHVARFILEGWQCLFLCFQFHFIQMFPSLFLKVLGTFSKHTTQINCTT